MAHIPDDPDVSLEEDRFEVDCWRYVGEPVTFGARGSGRAVWPGLLDTGKSGTAASNDKSEGWFGLNKHKRNRTISIQKRNRSEHVSANQPPPLPSNFGSHASRTLTASSTSTGLSPTSPSSSFASSAGQNGNPAESGVGLGIGLGPKKSSKGKKERSSFFGLGVGSRRNRKEEVESWRRARLICQGDLRGDDSVVTVYEGDNVVYRFRPCHLHTTDISVPHKSLYTDRPCIRIANIGKALVRDAGGITPVLSPSLDGKSSFLKSSPDSSKGTIPPRADSLGEVKRKLSTTPSLRSFASSHSLSLGSRPPPFPVIDSSLKTPATSPFPPQISPTAGQLTPLTGPWLSPVSSHTSFASNTSRRSSTSTYSTAQEEEEKDALSPLTKSSPLPAQTTVSLGAPLGARKEQTTPKANRTYRRKPSITSHHSDETIPRISLHAAHPSFSPTLTNAAESINELAVVFEDAHIQQAWFGLLKSLAKPEIVSLSSRSASAEPMSGLSERRRIHRILEVTVHDIKDLKINPKSDAAMGARNKRGIMRSISSGFGQTIKSLAEDDREEPGHGDSFFLEIRLDNEVIARTLDKTVDLGLIWSEAFHFTDIPEWHRLSFYLFRSSPDASPVSLSSVSVLATDLEPGRAVEGRYPFSNLMDEASGQLRVNIRSASLSLRNSASYQRVQTALCNPCKDNLCIAVNATAIAGGSVSLCRAGTALCSLDVLIRFLIDEEVQTPAATLFRANTPLTKLLETAMRIYAYEYVRSAVGPTVRDICERRLVLDDSTGREGNLNQADALGPFVQSLWNNIYMSRQSFPAFLRKVLSHLMIAVSKQHPASKKLQFQAVSSFLFLRLIGPNIMFPPCDIVSVPPSVDVQRTLKALAKPIMSLAFLVEASEQNLQEKGTNDFIEENSAALTDFLEACATIDDKDSVFAIDRRIEDIAAGLVKRKSGLEGLEQDAVFVLSAIGAVDLVKELAILSEGQMNLEDLPKRRDTSILSKKQADLQNGSTISHHVVMETKGGDGDTSALFSLGKAIDSLPRYSNGESRYTAKGHRPSKVLDLGNHSISKRSSSLSGATGPINKTA